MHKRQVPFFNYSFGRHNTPFPLPSLSLSRKLQITHEEFLEKSFPWERRSFTKEITRAIVVTTDNRSTTSGFINYRGYLPWSKVEIIMRRAAAYTALYGGFSDNTPDMSNGSSMRPL